MTSRAGDETLGWGDIGDKAGSVYLTESEIRLVERLVSGTPSLGVQAYAYGTQRRTLRRVGDLGVNSVAGYVPVSGGAAFPYYRSDDPW